MLCAAHRPVGYVPLLCIELGRIDLAQKLFAEEACDIAHIGRDARIARVKPGVAAAGVRKAQRQTHARKVRVHGDDLAGEEINIHRLAQRTGKLIHKPAGLAEMQVFRLLGNARHGIRLKLGVVV